MIIIDAVEHILVLVWRVTGLRVRRCHDRIPHNYPQQRNSAMIGTLLLHHYNQTAGGSWEDLLSSLCSEMNSSLHMARLLPSLLDSQAGQGPGLLLNGFRLFRDRAATMEASIWTPSVVTIKFNVKNGVLLKQRETNDFRVINSFVYFYHLKIINRSLVVLASYKIYDK